METSLYGYSLEDFREEAKELLSRAEAVLSDISESPDIENINALFRVIHSLKGSAAYAGLKDVNAFAHLYEGLLGDIRNGRLEIAQDVVKLLLRAKDFLEDLVFRPEDAGAFEIDETVRDSREQLTNILGGKGTHQAVAPREGGIPAAGPPEPAGEDAPPASREEKPVSLSTNSPLQMGQMDVIKITLTNILQSIHSCLKEAAPDKGVLGKYLAKLEGSLLWAFGEESTAITPLEEMKVLMDGELGPQGISQLRKGFNSLAKAIKSDISGTGGAKESEEPQVPSPAAEKKKVSPEEIRGASKDDIVKISLTRYLDTLSILLEEDAPDPFQMKKALDRLNDLNMWTFSENEDVSRFVKSMEDLLKRPSDKAVTGEMRQRFASIRPLFVSLTGERGKGEASAGTKGQEGIVAAVQPVASFEAPGQQPVRAPQVERPARGRVAPPQTGSTLRVRSEDVEELISAIGELTGLDAKDFERIQAHILKLRMVPVGELFGRFRKVVRDLSEELGKEIEIEIAGESVKLDKVIADRLNEPVLHMVRNAASHGLESLEDRKAAGKREAGLIRLNAYQEGGQVVIEISDDGRGISIERVRGKGIELGFLKEDEAVSEKAVLDLIFAPGFSTADEAGTVSGRGVGMDVVKEVLTSLQGTVAIDTREGAGTTFRLRLPLTLAVIKAMVVDMSGNRVALPSAYVDRVITMTDEEIRAVSVMDENRLSLDLAGEEGVLPLVDLPNIFGLKTAAGSKRCVVIVKAGMGQKVALVVDSTVGRQPLMVKPLDRFAGNRFFSSAAVVDNDIILILNTPAVMAA